MAAASARRLALVGCGWAGARHARAALANGATLRWLVDADEARARDLRDSLASLGTSGAPSAPGSAGGGPSAGKSPPSQARVATDYREALADPAVDAVDLCLPHHLHAPAAIAAAGAGKHVLVEKPLAATLDEADAMLRAAGDAGVTLMVAENVRFDPVYRKVRSLLRAGAIGRPALVQITREAYLTRSFLEERPWFLDARRAAGGIMMSGGVHDFETLRMLVGEIESVTALRARQRFPEMEGDDTSVALVRFRDGAAGTLVESFVMKSLTTASGPEVHTLRVDGELGSLSAGGGQTGGGRTITLFSERPDFLIGGDLVQHEIHVPQADTFALVVAHFLECVEQGREPETSGRSQRRPLEAVLAAYRSMETGMTVRLTDPGSSPRPAPRPAGTRRRSRR